MTKFFVVRYMPALELLNRIERNHFHQKPWSVSSPMYSIRARTRFGSMAAGTTSKDARPEVTSKDVIAALTNTLPRPPAFSLVSRSYIDDTRECTKSPGPQRYSQPGIISNLRHPLYPMPPTKLFAGSERKIHVPPKVPGPGDYEVSYDCILDRAPAYGLRSRELENISSALRPDSGSYNISEITRRGKVWRGPSWTALGRNASGSESTRALSDSESEKDLWRQMSQIDTSSSDSRKKLDVSGSKKMKPVPNWSFGRSLRFKFT
jgi:hypothetical protein